MIAVVQRVSRASVSVGAVPSGQIDQGLLVLLGIEKDDSMQDLEYVVKKVIEVRIFNDRENKMNRSLLDVGGSLLVVSQFTLAADTRKGRRPSFNQAADADLGERLYNEFINSARAQKVRVETGVFGAMMQVELINDGPVTIIIESRNRKGLTV